MQHSALSLSVSEISSAIAQANRGVKTVSTLETGETEHIILCPHLPYIHRWQIIANDGVL